MEIKVPPLGESVTEATVARWLKAAGDVVGVDEPVVELETDKVTLEVGAPKAGILAEIKVPQGGTVSVGATLGMVGEPGSGVSPAPAAAAAPSPSSPVNNSQDSPAAPSLGSSSSVSSPAARKIIEENKLEPEKMTGTGKDGRITKQDAIQAVATAPSSAGSSTPAISLVSSSNGAREHRVRLSRLRQKIAERLKQAQNTAAILTTFNEVDMTQVMGARDRYKDIFEKKHGVKLGFMSFFVKACVLALKEIPAVNAEIQGEELVYKNYYDLGVAVGTPNGLVVPVVRNADQRSFAELEKEIAALGLKARDGKLTMEELSGGTFTISNGGVYGSLMSTPILNPPQSAILGMHKIQKRPMVIGDKIEIRPMMYLALSYDHRIIDGREAVTFLIRIKECIEDPERLLLGM